MSLRTFVPALGTVLLVCSASTVNAQLFGSDCGCNTQSAVAPIYQQNACQTAMVMQPCYQQVPVTQYQEIQQTVRRPVVETKYVDREVTEYVPVEEERTAEIPVVKYTPVTEYQTVQRDASYWQTQYTPNCKMAPCQYDPRPGLLGWLNRTGYNIRSAFAPRYTTNRQYVQNVVAEQVPITRQVAQHGKRQVTYKVTKMVPRTTTRKVAVNEVRYVEEQVSAMRPVTVMRTVPVGTSVAFAPFGGGTATAFGGASNNVAYGPVIWNDTQTAFGPTPDPAFRSAERDEPIRSRKSKDGRFERNEKANDDFDTFGAPPTSSNDELTIPTFRKLTAVDRQKLLEERGLIAENDTEQAEPETQVAGIAATVKSYRWTSGSKESNGPELIGPELASINN
ncbi:hypothetical protein [Calycomorphotria hydatis]|nr:hypothetical protein [Calycomorphotria hydatis]